jgi:hypothetical protein
MTKPSRYKKEREGEGERERQIHTLSRFSAVNIVNGFGLDKREARFRAPVITTDDKAKQI